MAIRGAAGVVSHRNGLAHQPMTMPPLARRIFDWLLTGRGKKFLDGSSPQNTPLSTGQFDELVRRVKVEVINEMSGSQNAGGPVIVRLQPSELMSEKVLDEVETLTGS